VAEWSGGTGGEAMTRNDGFLEIIPGTGIDEIRAAHPDWTEEQCRDEQVRAALAAFTAPAPRGRKPRA
jgi:hypothetical protein